MSVEETKQLEKAILEIIAEFTRATEKYGAFISCHEGYAVIKEELEELWEEIKKKSNLRSRAILRREAIQVGAMAIRFIVDCIDNEKES